eukprot:gene12458-biopygen10767
MRAQDRRTLPRRQPELHHAADQGRAVVADRTPWAHGDLTDVGGDVPPVGLLYSFCAYISVLREIEGPDLEIQDEESQRFVNDSPRPHGDPLLSPESEEMDPPDVQKPRVL